MERGQSLRAKIANCIYLAVVVALVGCDYVPSQKFEIQTTDGEKVILLCPVIDPNRSALSYLIDGRCVVVLPDN